MTGKIEPGRLLTTLKVLLSPAGGIKSSEEVGRLVPLMEKFSRKLVSKVIYVRILRSSTHELLKIFLTENGWNLLTSWFTTAVNGYNWPLCSELLQVFLLCPPPPPPPIDRSVLHYLQFLHSNHQPDSPLSTLAGQVLATWTTSSTSRCPFLNTCLSSNPSPLLPTSSSSMSVSRRGNRSVIVSNPLVEATKSAPKMLMTVTYQEDPLQDILDVTKQKRRGETDLPVESQMWARQMGRKRKMQESEDNLCPEVQEENFRNQFETFGGFKKSFSTPSPLSSQLEDYSAQSSTSSTDDLDLISRDVPDERWRRSLKVLTGTPVRVLFDQDVIPQIVDLQDKPDDNFVEKETRPLKILEDIADELNQNLRIEKLSTQSQEPRRPSISVRSTEVGLWGVNNNKILGGFEGSAKDFRVARREKYREEQKQLESNEFKERKDREDEKERLKKVKREQSKEFNRMQETADREKREKEDKEKREKKENEFKNKREEEMTKRKEKERQEKDVVSFRKSELKNDLDKEEKLRIKLIAKQLKDSSAVANSNCSTSRLDFQGRIPKLDSVNKSDEVNSAQTKMSIKKPAKPLFSVAKNKNKDLLASLEDPAKPSKRQVAKDLNLIKKAHSLPSRRVSKPRSDYNLNIPVLDSTFQIPKKIKSDQDEVSSKPVKDESQSEEVIEPKSVTENSKVDSLEVSPSPTNVLEEPVVEITPNMASISEVEKSRLSENPSKRKENPKSDEILSHKNSKTRKSTKMRDTDQDKMKSKFNQAKPSLTLKPMSQLKESSVFGSFLEDVEKSSNRKRKSSTVDAKSKKLNDSKMDVVKNKIKIVPNCSSAKATTFEPVAIVSRKVSGILIVERGSGQQQKSIRWRDDQDLVQVEYFEVDASERANVHTLKFEEIRQQELVKEKTLLTTRHHHAMKELDERPWPGMEPLDSFGRSSFQPGERSGEKEIQKQREARVLPSVMFGSLPLDPTEPILSYNHSRSVKDILGEDISGEGTHVDYSGEEWPEGGMESLEQGVGTGQFYGSPDQFENKSSLNQGFDYDHGSNNGVGFAQRTNFPNMRGFGRGAAAFRGAQRGFKGGFGLRGRGGIGGKKRVPCKYWGRGKCREDEKCKYLHL